MTKTSEERALAYLKRVFEFDDDMTELPNEEEFVELIKGLRTQSGRLKSQIYVDQKAKFMGSIESLRSKDPSYTLTLVDEFFSLENGDLDIAGVGIIKDYLQNSRSYEMEVDREIKVSEGSKEYNVSASAVKNIVKIMKMNVLAFHTKQIETIEDVISALENADATTLPNIQKYYKERGGLVNRAYQVSNAERVLLDICNDVLTERSSELSRPHNPYDDIHDKSGDRGMSRRGEHQKKLRDESRLC